MGVAADASGDIFISDTANNVVREVNSAGVIVTLAGTATAGDRPNGSRLRPEPSTAPAAWPWTRGKPVHRRYGNDLVRELGARHRERSPAALTITATNETENYGQTLSFAPTAFTTSGLLNGDAVTSVTFTSTGGVGIGGGGRSIPVCSAAVGSDLSGLHDYLRQRHVDRRAG